MSDTLLDVIREHLAKSQAVTQDALRPIKALAREWGFEEGGFANFLDRHSVPTFKVGRQVAVRVSHVLALLDDPREAPPAVPPTDGPSLAKARLEALAADKRRAG
jgi:hypothetical protein